MQNWNDLIRTQLDNLASFPAKQTWKLGEWIGECAVRPEVANFAALPLVGNTIGEVRASVADQAWYIWDGAAWQSMGGGGGGAVNSVTASAPLASSGGANPNISLTGVVAAANGGTGLALTGALGNVLTSNGAGGWTSSAPATTSPAAPLTSVQFNNGGAFGGSAGLTWNGSTLAVDGAVDRATAGTLTVGGTTATAITVGAVGVTTTFPGPVNLTGDVTTVGGTQFTTDAQFDGNVTFGNASTDNISFVGQVDTAITQEGIAAPAVSPAGTGRIYFDSGTNTFKASQNGGAYVDIITGGTVTSVGATSPLASSGGATPTISFTGWPANASGALTNDGAGNLSWAPSGGGTITGSGVATQIAYFTGASAIGSETAVGSNSFTWDATNNRLGIGTNAPSFPVDIQAAYPQLALGTTAAGGAGAFRFRDGTGTLRADIGYAAAGSLLLQFTNNNSPVKIASTQNTAGNYVSIETGGSVGDVERVRFKVPADANEVVFNPTQVDYNFRVATTASANSLFVKGTGAVGIGTSTPTAAFSIYEKFQADSAGVIVKYANSAPADGELLIGSTGVGFNKTTLTAGTGISVTNGAGSITIAATGAAASTSVDIPSTAQEALNAGDLVRFVNDAGTPKVQKADATNADARLNPVGFAVAAASAGAAVTVRVSGAADVPAARFDAAPAAANVGSRVFVSTTSGQITLTAPSASGDILQRVGVLVDGSANPKVLVQIGDPTLL